MADGKVRFTKGDLKAGYLVKQPAWYEYELQPGFKSQRSSTGKSNIWITEWKGCSGEMDEVVVTKIFNDSKMGLTEMVKVFTAANNGNDLNEDAEYDFDSLVGVHLDVYTMRGENDKGQTINDLKDFRPVQSK